MKSLWTRNKCSKCGTVNKPIKVKQEKDNNTLPMYIFETEIYNCWYCGLNWSVNTFREKRKCETL